MNTRREATRPGRPLAACSGTGVFVGYASLFGRRDQSGDTVMPGAFTSSLARKGTGGIRMLFQHDPAEPVGTWLELRETTRGLYVRGRLDRNVQRGRELLSLLETGGLDGLSIGFRTVKAGRDGQGGRQLREIDLWEISLVTFPMLDGARIAGTEPDFSITQNKETAWTRLLKRKSPSATSWRPSRPSRMPMTSASDRSKSGCPPMA